MLSRSVWDKLSRSKRRQVRRIKIGAKNPIYAPVITGFLLILLAFILFNIFGNAPQIRVTPDSKIVIVSHDGIKQIVPSNDSTVGGLLHRLNIQIHTGDVVQPSLVTAINQDDFRINIQRAVPVEVINGSSVSYSQSAASTPRAIAQSTGTQIYAEDAVKTIPTENFLASGAIGQQVVIYPATPISLDFYGTTLMVRTYAATVSDFIKQENIQLAPNDQVVPTLNSALKPSGHVSITRPGVTTTSTTQTIPMPVQIVYVADLAYGTSSIVQQGSVGQEVTAYTTGSSVPFQTIVTQPAITEIVDEGDSLSGIQGDMSLAGISPPDYTYVDYIVSHESGWCPTKWQGDIGYCPAGFSQQYSNGDIIGYGLCQSTPPDKMSEFGADWQTDPITQLKWCNNYAVTKYGSWNNAYIHWTSHGSW